MTAPTAARELPGEVLTRRVITVVLALITALTFAFGFDGPGPGPQPHRRHARPSHADDDRRRQPPAHPGELAAIPS